MHLCIRLLQKTLNPLSNIKAVKRGRNSFWVHRSRACGIKLCDQGTAAQIAGEMAIEEDVGIVCYISSLPGFKGILKQRYADFIVNEVDPNGNVVELTSLNAPSEDLVNGHSEANKVEADAGLPVSDYTSELESFRVLAGDANVERLKEMLEMIKNDASDNYDILLLPDSDKSHRTELHTFFRKKFPFVVTDTITSSDTKDMCIRVTYKNKTKQRGKRHRDNNENEPAQKRQRDMKNMPVDRRGADYWPPDRPKFCHFHLCKENKGTQEALMVIGRKLGVKPRSFGFAGTKDKRGVTTQGVTVFKQQASKLAKLNNSLYGFKIGNFSYVDKALRLGDLSGNRFTVTLRNVVAEKDDYVRKAARTLKISGFINYFGLQRFGSESIPTHALGAKLLQGKWNEVVDLLLQPREGEHKAVLDAKESFQKSKNAEKAMRLMPNHMLAERQVLFGLNKDPDNRLQAILNIPRTLRMMYVHSYQSYLWNHAATYRLQKYGPSNVVEGDLVLCESENNGVNTSSEVDDECLDMDGDFDLGGESHKSVKHVTDEDINSGRYGIEDIVLPLPGSSVVYPKNDTAQVYQDLALKDGVDLTGSVHNVKEFSMEHLSGGYRHVIVKPRDMKWKIIKYDDSAKPLAVTDLDKVLGSPVKDADLDNSTGSLTALQLAFTLPTSSYATMAIRELLKGSTSVAEHKNLAEEAENQKKKAKA